MAEVFRDPYALADTALAAWVERDAERVGALLGAVPDASELERCGLGPNDAIEGLYFEALRSPRVNAIVRTDPPCWFAIERSGGGFVLRGLHTGSEAPPTRYHVEG